MLKLATIGRGPIVEDALDALKDVDSLEPAAVYSRSLEDADAFARKHSIQKSYDDLDAMLSDPDIDVIYIASPNALHYSQAKKALEHKKHVILEKPFVSSYEQAKDLFESAEKNGVMIFEAITTPHMDNFKRLKDNLFKAGKIQQVLLNFSQYSSRYDQYKQGIVTNAFDPAMDGGALMDINLYNIHFANALFGRPLLVRYFPQLGFNGVDTSGVLLMQYPDFLVTAIGSKDNAMGHEFLIAGQEGVFRIGQGGVNLMKHVEFEPLKSQSEDLSLPFRNRMSFEFADFARAIKENDQKAYREWKEETLAVQQILDEAKAQRDAFAKNPALLRSL